MTWLTALFRKPASDVMADAPDLSERTLDEETLLVIGDQDDGVRFTADTKSVMRLVQMGLVIVTTRLTPEGRALVDELNGRAK